MLKFLIILLYFLTPNQVISKENKAKINCEYNNNGYSSLVEKILPAVVNISTITTIEKNTFSFNEYQDSLIQNQFFKDFPYKKKKKRFNSLGSGFLIDKDGYIVTNYHVIANSTEILVTTYDDKEYIATLKNFDEASDLALIKINIEKPYFVNFGKSSDIKIGDFVLTIGNQFGFGSSVTQGIVSGKSRSVSGHLYDNLIQTDSAINSGNSGGPMFNLCGEVVGINTSIVSPNGGNIGLGFAISSDFAINIVEKMKKNEKISRSILGVSVKIINSDAKEALGFSGNGVFVESVTQNESAYKAGIKSGDIITKIDNLQAIEPAKIASYISSKKTGENLEIEIFRNGKNKKIIAKLQEKTDTNEHIEKYVKSKGFDLEVFELSPQLRIMLKIPIEVNFGVVVVDIRNEKILEYESIKEYDVITHVNGIEINSVKEFEKEYKNFIKSKRKNVMFKIYRNGNWESIPVLVK